MAKDEKFVKDVLKAFDQKITAAKQARDQATGGDKQSLQQQLTLLENARTAVAACCVAADQSISI